jgi:hypothetical protein
MFVKLHRVMNRHHWAVSLRIFRLPIFAFSLSKGTAWVRFFGRGISVTTQPLFSVRNRLKKSLKLGKFYFELL